MLVRNLTADHVYLACGRTDMRKSIDGLAALVLSKFQLDPHQPALFLFAAAVKTVSRDCYGMRQDSSCSTNAWRMVSINGRTRRKTCWKFPSSSFAGLPKACPSHSPKLYKRSPLHTAFNLKLCTITVNLWIAQPTSILNSRAFCGIMGREN